MVEHDEIRYLIYGIAFLFCLIIIKEILLPNETFVEWFNNATGFKN